MRKLLLGYGFLALSTAAIGQTIVSEDFNSGVPSGWTQITNATDGGWLAGNAGSLSSSSWAVAEHGNFVASNDDGCNCDKSADYLVMEELDLSSYSGQALRLAFDLFFWGASYQGATEVFTVVASIDNGSNWTTVYTATGDGNWQDGINVDMSSYAGESSVLIAFLFDDGGGWTYGAAIDNVSLSVPLPIDLKLTSASLKKYVIAGATANITGTVLNYGTSTANGYVISWTDGTNTYNHTVTASLAPGASANFTHGTPVDPVAGVTMNITVAAVIAGDGDLSNNSLNLTATEAAFEPFKVVLGEEATGTWCGWCPRGAVYMDYMAETYPETWAGVAVHNGDPMVNTIYDSWMGSMISGYPSGLVDRNPSPFDPTEFEAAYNDAVQNFAVANIGIDAVMDVDRMLTVTITAHFAVSSNDPMRLAAIITEDNMTGNTSQWSQANYYSGGASGNLSGAGHDWHLEPNPVPYTDMEYDHVGRELLGGVDGDAGSVNSSVNADDSVTYTYTFSMPTTINELNAHIVAILIDNTTGLVLNAGIKELAYQYEEDGIVYQVENGDTMTMVHGQWTSLSELEMWNGQWVPLGANGLNTEVITMYPNPTSNVIYFNNVKGISNLQVLDARGELVMNKKVGGNSLDVSSLQAGFYTIQISNNGSVAREKITIIH